MLHLLVPHLDHLPSYIESTQAIMRLQPHRKERCEQELEKIASDPERFIKDLSGDESEQNFLLFDDSEMVGLFSFRPALDEALENFGGHIGFGISPQHWRKGYGTKGLALMLGHARHQGLEKVVLTCDSDNIGSEKVILENEGCFVGYVQDKHGRGINKKFVIEL
jgi:predicted acetyltransferase